MQILQTIEILHIILITKFEISHGKRSLLEKLEHTLKSYSCYIKKNFNHFIAKI